MIGMRVRPDGQVDAVADGVVPGPPHADDPPVLDPDVGLDRTEHRVEDEGAGDDRRRARSRTAAPGSPAAGGSWRSPRSARRRGPGGPRRRGPTGPCRRGAPGRRWSGRSGPGARPGRGRVIARTRTTVRVSPGAQRSVEPAGMSRWKPVADGAIEHEPLVHPLERVVADDTRIDPGRRATRPRGSGARGRRGAGRPVRPGGSPRAHRARPGRAARAARRGACRRP